MQPPDLCRSRRRTIDRPSTASSTPIAAQSPTNPPGGPSGAKPMAVRACPISASSRGRPGRHHRARRPTRPRCLSPASRLRNCRTGASGYQPVRYPARSGKLWAGVDVHDRRPRRHAELLQSQQPQLERALEQAGLKTADNGLQFHAARSIVRRPEQRFKPAAKQQRTACHSRSRSAAGQRHADLFARSAAAAELISAFERPPF